VLQVFYRKPPQKQRLLHIGLRPVIPFVQLWAKPACQYPKSRYERTVNSAVIAAVVCFVVLGAFHFLFTRLLSLRKVIFSPTDILEEPFSAERYRAMDRLLDSADGSFLASHPGCTRRMKRRFRQARISLFRAYLKLLSEDFSRICRAIKLHVISAEADRSELAAFMLKEQFRFAKNMLAVEFKLAMYAGGWKGIDASGLIASLGAMRDRLQTLAAMAEPTVA